MKRRFRRNFVALSIAVVLTGGLAGRAIAVPANDLCIDATPLGECDVTVAFDTSGAATDGNAHAACLAFANDQIFNDVWYCWTAPQAATATIETCGLTGLDTKIGAYGPFDDCTLAEAACVPGDGDLQACNDDACPLQSQVQLQAEAGKAYLLRLGSFSPAETGSGDLAISCEASVEMCTAAGPIPASVCQEPDQVSAVRSDVVNATAADNVTPTVDTEVSRLRWWGVYFSGVDDCSPGPGDAFQVSYYLDAGGLPGALHAGPFPIGDLEKCTTGETTVGFLDEYQFDGTHPPVQLDGGITYWVEIANDTIGGCDWFWATGPGDGIAAAGDGSGGFSPIGGDLAFCYQTISRICRSAGSWSTRSGTAGGAINVTQEVLTAGGGCLEVCGEVIRTTNVDDADSAVEALCSRIQGTEERQLTRQLVAAGLNCVTSGFGPLCTGWVAVEHLYHECNMVCEGEPGGLTVGECIAMLSCFNTGGDPFTQPGTCYTGTCSDNGQPCDSRDKSNCTDPPLASCDPDPESCHLRDICNDGVGVCIPPGTPSDPTTCKRARSSPCTVPEVGRTTEDDCDTGVRLPDESCCLDAGGCDDGDICTDDMCVEGPGCSQVPIPNCCESDADCTNPSLPVCDLSVNLCVTTTTTTSSTTSTSTTSTSTTSTSTTSSTSTTASSTTTISTTTTSSTSSSTSTTIDSLPMVLDDDYDVIGNVSIMVDAANGVLMNDSDNEGPVTVVAADATSGAGGQVSVAADGSFTYDPPAGFEGMDTFMYTGEDNVGQNAMATVALTVDEVVWFIDNTAAGGGDGRLSAPYNLLSDYSSLAADDPDDIVFVFEGDGTTTNLDTGITLQNSQLLIGQGVDLVTAAGLTVPPFSVTLPGATARPTLGNTAGAGITLASANTVRGLDVNAQSGIAGAAVGAAMISDVAVTSTAGPGVDINGGGTVGITLDSVNATNSSGAGVSLQSMGGTSTFNALTVTNMGGTGLLANNAGTINITGATNDIATMNGTAVNLASTTIGGSGVTFESVSASNATNGIVLNTTGAGAFAVTGDGSTANSGGAITTMSGDGISLTSASNVSLSFMNVDGNDGNGIFGSELTNFSLADSTVQNNANAAGEAGLRFNNLLGTCSVTDSTISNSYEDNIRMTPSSGTLTLLTISGTTVGPNPVGTGGNGLTLLSSGAASTTVAIESTSLFTGNQASGVLTTYAGTGTHDMTVQDSMFTNNNIAVDLASSGSGNWTFDVLTNTMTGQKTDAILVLQGSDSTSTATGTVDGNLIGDGTADSGARDQYGIHVDARSGVMVLAVTNNTVKNTDFDGIFIQTREVSGSVGVADMDLTLTGNTVFPPDDNSGFPLGAVHGVRVESRHTTTLCANVASNESQPSGAGSGYRLRERDTSAFSLQGFNTNVATTLTNNGNTTGGGAPTVSTTGEAFAGACTPATP